LQLEIAREIFRTNLARAVLELQGGMERVVDCFYKPDDRQDVLVAQAGAQRLAL
jgi:hypothetical protein